MEAFRKKAEKIELSKKIENVTQEKMRIEYFYVHDLKKMEAKQQEMQVELDE